jgi:hypothetical protein
MLKLALISDIHHGPDNAFVKGSAALGLLETAISHLAARQPDLTIDLGDHITDEAPELDEQRLAEVIKLYSAFSCPREYLRGNHDLVTLALQEEMLSGSLKSRSLDLNNWHLIFLDTFNQTIEGCLSEETLRWLERDLAATSLPVIVFSHQPLDGERLIGSPIFEVDFADHAHPKGFERARELIEASGKVKLAFNGHCHWNHLVQRKGVSYITLQSLVAQTPSGPAGTYAFISLTETEMRLEVFGLEAYSLHFVW